MLKLEIKSKRNFIILVSLLLLAVFGCATEPAPLPEKKDGADEGDSNNPVVVNVPSNAGLPQVGTNPKITPGTGTPVTTPVSPIAPVAGTGTGLDPNANQEVDDPNSNNNPNNSGYAQALPWNHNPNSSTGTGTGTSNTNCSEIHNQKVQFPQGYDSSQVQVVAELKPLKKLVLFVDALNVRDTPSYPNSNIIGELNGAQPEIWQDKVLVDLHVIHQENSGTSDWFSLVDKATCRRIGWVARNYNSKIYAATQG